LLTKKGKCSGFFEKRVRVQATPEREGVDEEKETARVSQRGALATGVPDKGLTGNRSEPDGTPEKNEGSTRNPVGRKNCFQRSEPRRPKEAFVTKEAAGHRKWGGKSA